MTTEAKPAPHKGIKRARRTPQQRRLAGIKPGTPYPQGATWDGKGVNFSLFSPISELVELCLFDGPERKAEGQRITLTERTNGVWHIYVPDLKPGQLYGYRVYGPYDPANGLRFNPNKLLLDPYAKAIAREMKWSDELFGYQIGHTDKDLSFDDRDSAAFAPLAAVIDPTFDWSDEKRPSVSWPETVIYEAHVKGMTKTNPHIPEALRGTYKGLASDPMLEHLKKLGVTTVELMPVHYFVNDRHLVEKGLKNYWGYNTLGFFAPEDSYCSERDGIFAVKEFKEMVKRFHNAGFEVVMDVVYNHTAEGNEQGPTLSFRGIDNMAYYRTVSENHRFYMDYTGCGNTLNMVTPHSLQFLMDSLRYWVTEMHVDGFRFDLASALARELKDVNQLGPFFDTLYQDPTLATTKLIAEPWDLGDGGYQVGNFPVGWTEWNGRYRDTVRKYWKGDMGLHSEVATRLGGSSDLYEHTGRLPSASINFITAHDGMTLHDLVSYQQKHNEANLDENRDGTDDNHSWNCGTEGPTDDKDILALRERQKRNLWSTLLLSQGVPMICYGDEYGRTQKGNNNGYCQDNELTWFDWKWSADQKSFFDFASKIVEIRRKHPSFRRRAFKKALPGEPAQTSVRWYTADGHEMAIDDWDNGGWMRTLGMYMDGGAPEIRDPEGREVSDNDFLMLLNAHHEQVEFTLPTSEGAAPWTLVVDTAKPEVRAHSTDVGTKYSMEGRSLVLVSRKRPPEPEAPAPQA